MPARIRRNTVVERPLKFHQRLVLFKYILNLFDVSSFEKLTEEMKEPEKEGFDENNQTYYYSFLTNRLFDWQYITKEELLTYDQNLVRHWKSITEKRNVKGYILYPK